MTPVSSTAILTAVLPVVMSQAAGRLSLLRYQAWLCDSGSVATSAKATGDSENAAEAARMTAVERAMVLPPVIEYALSRASGQ